MTLSTTPTPTPIATVSATPSCGTQAQCRKDAEATSNGLGILVALVVALCFLAWMSMKRSSR